METTISRTTDYQAGEDGKESIIEGRPYVVVKGVEAPESVARKYLEVVKILREATEEKEEEADA